MVGIYGKLRAIGDSSAQVVATHIIILSHGVTPPYLVGGVISVYAKYTPQVLQLQQVT